MSTWNLFCRIGAIEVSPNYADKEKYFPYATVILCTVMIGIFMLGLFFPEFSDILTNSTSKISQEHYWAFLTSSLVHSQWWHLPLNVPIILYLGYKVESRWGSILFIVIVLLSSIASDMFFITDPQASLGGLGASPSLGFDLESSLGGTTM